MGNQDNFNESGRTSAAVISSSPYHRDAEELKIIKAALRTGLPRNLNGEHLLVEPITGKDSKYKDAAYLVRMGEHKHIIQESKQAKPEDRKKEYIDEIAKFAKIIEDSKKENKNHNSPG